MNTSSGDIYARKFGFGSGSDAIQRPFCRRSGTGDRAGSRPEGPAFSLSTPGGQPMSLASLTDEGPVALIVLRGYPGYQCPYCVRQVHDFVENAANFAAAGTQVLLVYPGPHADLDRHAMEFLAKQNPLPSNLSLVIDPDYTFTNLYGLRWDAPHETAYPSTFLIDRSFYRKISQEHGDRTTAAEF
jgi:peroxiredoxin